MKLNRVRKPLTALLASAVLGVSVLGTLPASALTSGFLGDVNGDDTISMSDTVALGKFLYGGYALEDPSVADVNDDGVVDVTDKNILSAFLVGSIRKLPYTGD